MSGRQGVVDHGGSLGEGWIMVALGEGWIMVHGSWGGGVGMVWVAGGSIGEGWIYS